MAVKMVLDTKRLYLFMPFPFATPAGAAGRVKCSADDCRVFGQFAAVITIVYNKAFLNASKKAAFHRFSGKPVRRFSLQTAEKSAAHAEVRASLEYVVPPPAKRLCCGLSE